MDELDLTHDGAIKRFQDIFTMVDLLVLQLQFRGTITHHTTYELVGDIKDGGLGSWRGSYVDSWYRSNHFHPFDEKEDEEIDPPSTKGERVEFKLSEHKPEHPLKMCYHPDGSTSDTPCQCYRSPDSLFCSAHTRMIKGESSYLTKDFPSDSTSGDQTPVPKNSFTQEQVDHIVHVRLVKVWKMLEEALSEVGGPPSEIKVAYSYGENLYDGEAILKRVAWTVDV